LEVIQKFGKNQLKGTVENDVDTHYAFLYIFAIKRSKTASLSFLATVGRRSFPVAAFIPPAGIILIPDQFLPQTQDIPFPPIISRHFALTIRIAYRIRFRALRNDICYFSHVKNYDSI